jgi:AAA+ superfamily predicted ATPase
MTASAKKSRKKSAPRAETRAANEHALSAELELVLARFRLLATRRALWLQKLWRDEGELNFTTAISHREAESHLADLDSPQAEADWFKSDETIRGFNEKLSKVEASLEQVKQSRLAELNQIFGLSAEEANLLQACAAIALDPSLGRVCAYLQDHTGRAYMTVDLAARLFQYGRGSVWSAESALFRWELVAARETGPGEPHALVCDPQVSDWLRGTNALDEALIGIAHLHVPRPALPSWPVKENLEFLKQTIHGEAPARVRLNINGTPGSGRRTFAATLSAELGLPLLVIDADQIDEQNWRRVFLRAERHAFLERCALAWTGESLSRRLWPQVVPFFPLQFLICEAALEAMPIPELIERKIKMPALALAEREALWREYVPASKKWPGEDFNALAQSYRVNVGDIAGAARTRVENSQEAGESVRQAARTRLGNLAQLLKCPFGWDDLVLPETLRETLRDIVFEASTRGVFWENQNALRMFPQGRGLMALFSGPPGTGKTMAAQVIAASLKYDLFRIDLSSVVSKYVGETSQNLERILSRAAEMDAVLLFDEADAMFSKRSNEIRDAQDKFANTDAAYLLQAIESYPGIALLATNQKSNIDPAFIRRLRFVVSFPLPDAPQRLEIWRNVVTGLTDEKRLSELDGGLKVLAESIDATGAQIKYAVLGALFVAKREGGELSVEHLLRGLERELAKEGRGLSSRERERILKRGA